MGAVALQQSAPGRFLMPMSIALPRSSHQDGSEGQEKKRKHSTKGGGWLLLHDTSRLRSLLFSATHFRACHRASRLLRPRGGRSLRSGARYVVVFGSGGLGVPQRGRSGLRVGMAFRGPFWRVLMSVPRKAPSKRGADVFVVDPVLPALLEILSLIPRGSLIGSVFEPGLFLDPL